MLCGLSEFILLSIHSQDKKLQQLIFVQVLPAKMVQAAASHLWESSVIVNLGMRV